RDLRPGVAHFLPDLTAETMDARRVAILLGQKRQHRFRDLGQYPGRLIVIEVNLAGHKFYPTLPSKLMPRSFCASTANSIGNSLKTCLQKPLTIMFPAFSVKLRRSRH